MELFELSEVSDNEHLKKLTNLLTARLIELDNLEKKVLLADLERFSDLFDFLPLFIIRVYSKDFFAIQIFSSICNYNTVKKDTIRVTETKGLQTITKLWSLSGSSVHSLNRNTKLRANDQGFLTGSTF